MKSTAIIKYCSCAFLGAFGVLISDNVGKSCGPTITSLGVRFCERLRMRDDPARHQACAGVTRLMTTISESGVLDPHSWLQGETVSTLTHS